MKKALIYWFSFLLILLFMTSCGTRKMQKYQDKKEVEASSDTTVKNDLTVADTSNVRVIREVKCNDSTITITEMVKPINPTKPSSFIDEKGNKKELNNASYTREQTRSKKQTSAKVESTEAVGHKTTDKSQKSTNSKLKANEDLAIKNTQRTSPSWWSLLWLLIPVGLYLLWKNKDKIWWV